MQDIVSLVAKLRRPRLLTRAARHGLPHYRRGTHLSRLLQSPGPWRSGRAIMRLLELEAELDERRRLKDANYTPTRHVEVLIALLGEVELLKNAQRPQIE